MVNDYETLAGTPLPGVSLKRVAVMVNTVSGKGTGLEILDRVKPLLESAGTSVEVLPLRCAGHARKIALQSDLSAVDCLCAIGGDGTAHETVNGLLGRPGDDNTPDRLVVGLIPGGSGNTLAHDLKISSPEDFVRHFLAGRVRKIDALEISTPPATESEHERDDAVDPYPDRCFSINMAGWGLPAQVLRAANGLRWWGSAQYNVAAYLTLVRNRSYRCTVTLVDKHDKRTTVSDSYVMVQAQNTVHMGEKLPFCPGARLDDGLVDLVLIRRASRRALMKLMARARSGTHIEDDITSYFQCRSFTIDPHPEERFAGTGTMNVDGELVGGTPMTAKVLPGAVRFVTG